MNYKAIIATSLLFPMVALADASHWQIIPTESQLTFTGTQNAAPVKGEFKKFSGDIIVDPNDYKQSKIDIIVDIGSLSASYADLVTTLVAPDWFDAKLFPKAEFKADNFEKTGENNYLAHGNLTIRDKTVPVTLTFTTEQPSANKGIVTGSTTLKRSAFGVGQGDWASTDEIKDEVTVNFKVSALKQ